MVVCDCSRTPESESSPPMIDFEIAQGIDGAPTTEMGLHAFQCPLVGSEVINPRFVRYVEEHLCFEVFIGEELSEARQEHLKEISDILGNLPGCPSRKRRWYSPFILAYIVGANPSTPLGKER